MDRSFSLNEDSPSDLDTTLDRNISHVIDVLNKENLNESSQSDSTTAVSHVLQGVRAYVEVRTNSDNRSQAVNRMLRSLGAEVEKTFTNEVTHVIFKDGNKRTIDKAKKKGIHLVSVLWVDSCLRNDRKVSEDIYPALLPQRQKSTPILFKKNRLKKMKSMQPNDFEEDVAKSSERYERKRRKDAEKLGMSGSTTPIASPVILAPDTCLRSPPSPSDWRSPIALVIPDTPPSMKAQIHKIREARRNSSICSNNDSPLIGSAPVQPLHRKLFNGVEGKSSPGISSLNALFTAEIKTTSCHSDTVTKQPEKIQESVSTAPKRKLFNLNNSPQTFLVEPTHCSEKRLPTLIDSNPRSKKTKKVTGASSKVKGEKRKKNEEEGSSTGETKTKKRSKPSSEIEEMMKTASSTTSEDISEKRDECVTIFNQMEDSVSKSVKPVKDIHAQYLLRRLEGIDKPDLDLCETNNSVTQRRSSRRSSVLLRSNQSNSSLDGSGHKKDNRRVSIAMVPDLNHSVGDKISCPSKTEDSRSSKTHCKQSSNKTTPELSTDKTKRSSRRASMVVTPDFSSTNNSLRRSSRRMSAACFSGSDWTLSRHNSPDNLVDSQDTVHSSISNRKVNGSKKLDESDTIDSTNNQKLSAIKTLDDRDMVNSPSNVSKNKSSEETFTSESCRNFSSKTDIGPDDDGNKVSGKSMSKSIKKRRSCVAKAIPSAETLNGIIEKTENHSEKASRHSDVKNSSCNRTLDHPDSSRNDTTGFLGASMSTIFGDTSLPFFTQSNSRRSIDEFKTFSRKKTSARNTLSSICEIEQNMSEKTKIPTKSQKKGKKKSQKKSKEFENISMELPEEEIGHLQGDLLTLRRASSFCKETSPGDAGGKITRPTIVMTSLHKGEQEVVSAVIKKLGGFLLVDNVNDATTHVVCGDARRTLNVLNGIARGCWLLHKEWVLKSLDTGDWLDEEDYEVCDIFSTCKMTRKQRQECGRSYRQSLFSDIGSVFISSRCSPPRSAVVNLLRLCGGEVTGSVTRCDLFIGDEASKNKTSIKPIWILDCIMEHKLLDYNQPKYLLKEVSNRASSPEF